MTSADLIEFVGYLAGAYAVGFAAGFYMATFKKAVGQVS